MTNLLQYHYEFGVIKMIFLTIGEKLRKLRQQLDIEQDILTEIGVSRNFISLLENNKRDLTEARATQITKLLRRIADEKNIELNISDDYLKLNPLQEARKYCLSSLEDVKTLKEATQIYEIVRSYNLEDVKPKYFLTLADMFFNEKDYTKSFLYYLDALDSHTKINDFTKTAYIYNRLGRCRDLRLDYSEALSYFIKAYEASIRYDEKCIKKISLYNISWCSYNLGKYKDSINYINRYLELCDTKKSFDDFIRAMILKASCFVNLEDTQAAVSLYYNIIKLFKEDFNPMLGYIYNNLGDISASIQMADQAFEYFQKAQSLRERYDIERTSYTLLCKANLYIQLENYSDALLEVVQAIAYAKSFKDDDCLYKCYLVLEKIYNHDNNYDKLIQLYNDMLILLKDSSLKDMEMKIRAKLSILSLKSNNLDNCLYHLENIVNI